MLARRIWTPTGLIRQRWPPFEPKGTHHCGNKWGGQILLIHTCAQRLRAFAVGRFRFPTQAPSPEASRIQLVVVVAVGGIFGIEGLTGEPDGAVELAGLGGTVKAGLTGAELSAAEGLSFVLQPHRASRVNNRIMRFMVVGGVEVMGSVWLQFFPVFWLGQQAFRDFTEDLPAVVRTGCFYFL